MGGDQLQRQLVRYIVLHFDAVGGGRECTIEARGWALTFMGLRYALGVGFVNMAGFHRGAARITHASDKHAPSWS